MSFNPYASNGGSILAIAGADYAIVAGDTRQSDGYNIQSRNMSKVWSLNGTTTMAATGFAADGNALVKKIKQMLQLYKFANQKDMPIKSVARMVQGLLYGKRFFPYYVHVILGGIEPDGTGAIYSFDPVGSYERQSCSSAGAADPLIQPFLDNQVYFKNQSNNTETPGNLPMPYVISLITDVFTGATERHIEVGDSLEMYVVTSKGCETDMLSSLQDTEVITPGASDQHGLFVVRRELKKD